MQRTSLQPLGCQPEEQVRFLEVALWLMTSCQEPGGVSELGEFSISFYCAILQGPVRDP